MQQIPGQVCRKALGECDLPEHCDGKNEFCPDNVFKHNSEECGYGQAFCYQGKCRSHNDQCKKLWGKSSKSTEVCYSQMNIGGSSYGNCGSDEFGNFKPCSSNDFMCGKLHCDSLEGNMQYKRGLKQMTNSKFNRVTCWGAEFSPVDEGLVPNGAKCGVDKLCLNQKCISVDKLKVQCPDCHGHGVCNSKGNCHCDKGWAPPFCNEPGDGGSIDSRGEVDDNSKFSIINLLVL